MALQVPSGLYNQFTEVLDSSPTANFLKQQQLRKQAKEDAFEQYVRGLNTKINSAGHRTAENEVFSDKLQQWQKFGIANKDKLMKNDINTRTEFDRMYQELLNITNESKSEEEKKKPLVEMILDPVKRDRLSSNVIPEIAIHDEPLYVKDKSGEWVRNPIRKSIDYTSNLFDPQFDMAKSFDNWSKGMKMGERIGETLRKDAQTGQVIKEAITEYAPEQIKQIAANAARSVDDNPSNRNYYQHRYEKLSEEEYRNLNKAFQSVYGDKIKLPNGQVLPNSIDSPQEIAAAEAIMQAQSLTKKGEKAVVDFEGREAAKLKNKIDYAYVNDALIRGRQRLTNAGGNLSNYDVLGLYYNKAKPTVIKKVTGSWLNPKTEETTEYRIPANEVDANHKKLFGNVAPYIDGTDRYYKVREGGDWEGNGGQVISRVSVATEKQNRTSLSEEKRGVPDMKGMGSQNPKPPTPKTNTYKKADLLKAGWTEDQIKKAVKAGKIKVQ